MELARLKRSHVKGHHVFKSESRPGDTFTCAREPGNPHSPDAIIVKLSDGSNVGHVPDPLARVLAPMLDGGEIERMEGTVTGVARSEPEGVWVPGGGIEFPCEYVLYGAKKVRESVRLSQKYRSQENEKRRLNYLSYCLLFIVLAVLLLH